MPTQLPADPVLFEQAIRAAIRDTLLSVPVIAAMTVVHARERFLDTDADDISLSTVPDPVNSDIPFTSIIQIGLPSVEEQEYTGDTSTHIVFSYPISFDMGIKDLWADSGLEFSNSSDLAMAIYMRARAAFKRNRTLGFTNCSHEYLQQESIGTVPDEETGSRLHMADWSLTVKCTSVVV